MRQFRKYNFETLFLNECRGKQDCSVTVPFEEFARNPPSSQRLNMLLFAQVACTQSEEALVMKNRWGLAAACIGLFMCLIFTSFVRKMLHEDKINDKLLDLRLVTVDDYTTQTLLNPKIYANFVKTLPNRDDPKAVPVMEFKKSMAEKITSQLQVDRDEIVDIHFGFNNSRMLNKLEERAEALKAAEFQKIMGIAEEMKELKDNHLDEINTPNYMWVTYKSDTSVQAAFSKKKFKFDEHEFVVKRAQHPTDIKFENREISPANHKSRKCCFIIFVVIFGIIFFFCGNWLVMKMQVISFMQQPPLTNCDSIISQYDHDSL